MNITAHAAKRCKQRGIPEYLLDALLESGTTESKPGNATLLKIGKKEIDWIIHDLKAMIQQLDRLKRTKIGAVMADADRAILTTYKIYG
mgnify:FL=1